MNWSRWQHRSEIRRRLSSLLNFLRHCRILERKIIHSKLLNPRLLYPVFANWYILMVDSNRTFSELGNFLWMKFCKFALKCDWYSKISGNVQNLDSFWLVSLFFFPQKLDFKGGKLALEYISNDNIVSKIILSTWIDGFSAKIRKKLDLEKSRILLKVDFFQKKCFHASKRYTQQSSRAETLPIMPCRFVWLSHNWVIEYLTLWFHILLQRTVVALRQ